MNDYEPTQEMLDRIENEGAYHAPRGNQVERYETIRSAVKELKFLIVRNTPPSREQSSALTALDDATFWANASIARHEKGL